MLQPSIATCLLFCLHTATFSTLIISSCLVQFHLWSVSSLGRNSNAWSKYMVKSNHLCNSTNVNSKQQLKLSICMLFNLFHVASLATYLPSSMHILLNLPCCISCSTLLIHCHLPPSRINFFNLVEVQHTIQSHHACRSQHATTWNFMCLITCICN